MTFEMWSFGHYLFIVSPFITAVIFHYVWKHKTYEQKRWIGIYLSMTAIAILLLRNIEIWVNRDFAFDFELVPLQICHFANFVLLFAFLKDSKPMFAFAVLLNLPAAFLSIFYANSLANYSTIITFRGFAYIFGHLLIVSITLWAFTNKFVELNRAIFIKTLKIVGSLYVLSLFINNFFRIVFGQTSNYFYAFKPEEGTPLELFYDWGTNYIILNTFKVNPIYLVLTAALGLCIMFILYLGLKHVLMLHEKKKIRELATE